MWLSIQRHRRHNSVFDALKFQDTVVSVCGCLFCVTDGTADFMTAHKLEDTVVSASVC